MEATGGMRGREGADRAAAPANGSGGSGGGGGEQRKRRRRFEPLDAPGPADEVSRAHETSCKGNRKQGEKRTCLYC